MKCRQPLTERGPTAEWTQLESAIFNAITLHAETGLLFSKRLIATDLMLEALDKYVEFEAKQRAMP